MSSLDPTMKRERQEHNTGYRSQYTEPGFNADTRPNNYRRPPRKNTPVKRRRLFQTEQPGAERNASTTCVDDDSPESRSYRGIHPPTTSASDPMAVTMGEQFRKLDASIPEEDRRMLQRQRAVLKGKNTVGYDAYTGQVKKHERSIRHPRTPDHTLDIPNRRWLGLVKSWRIALHKYDPEDLQTEFDAAKDKTGKPKPADTAASAKLMTEQERQIAEASTKGLLVDFGNTDQPVKDEDGGLQKEKHSVVGSPMVVVGKEEVMEELDKLEAGCDDEDFLDYDDDSDDDLL